MNRFETAIFEYEKILEEIKERLDQIKKIQDDPCMVQFEYSHRNISSEDIGKWLFENNVVAVFKRINLNLPNVDPDLIWCGWRFKNTEDALAFKLRWVE